MDGPSRPSGGASAVAGARYTSLRLLAQSRRTHTDTTISNFVVHPERQKRQAAISENRLEAEDERRRCDAQAREALRTYRGHWRGEFAQHTHSSETQHPSAMRAGRDGTSRNHRGNSGSLVVKPPPCLTPGGRTTTLTARAPGDLRKQTCAPIGPTSLAATDYSRARGTKSTTCARSLGLRGHQEDKSWTTPTSCRRIQRWASLLCLMGHHGAKHAKPSHHHRPLLPMAGYVVRGAMAQPTLLLLPDGDHHLER